VSQCPIADTPALVRVAEPSAVSSKEELFELLIESATGFAIFTTDLDGVVTSWNSGAERLFGYSEGEILGSTADVTFTPEDRARGAAERERITAQRDGRASDERWHLRKNGSRFWASGLLMPLKGAEGYVKITQDHTQRHVSEERLRESEQRFRLLASSIPQLVFLTRPDGNRTWPSPQWIAFTGVGFDESLGLNWLDAIHPHDREATLKAWDEARASGQYYIEHRVRRQSDGEYLWHQTRAKPVATPDGPSEEWVGTMTDIHHLRGLQGRQQVLIAELQHRTRNLLAVVQAIANQTLRSSESLDAFKKQFNSRLAAVSRVQSLLAEVEDRTVDLHDLVAAELAAHTDSASGSDKIEIDGPSVALPANAAQAIGLALHELATNAVKYGALGHRAGRLQVSWEFMHETPAPQVALRWIETGVSVETPKRKGYGSELIERALPYQLQARTHLDFSPQGLRCEIVVPIRANPSNG
jgi:PAS domain S-box-containing protein